MLHKDEGERCEAGPEGVERGEGLCGSRMLLRMSALAAAAAVERRYWRTSEAVTGRQRPVGVAGEAEEMVAAVGDEVDGVGARSHVVSL